MELNRGQLLIHNDSTLEKFRGDYGIPNDVQIEHLCPNEDANLVKGNEDRILVRIWLIYQARFRFSISQILKEVMSCCYLMFSRH